MISKANISLRGLRTFCFAARYLSFNTAAKELFLTPSAVSHQIKSLEQELDEQLFDRTGRSLKLTETGKTLYEQLSPLIDQLDAVMADFKESARRSSIRISVQPFFASELFVPRLGDFTASHPEIDIQVGTSDESAEKHPTDADLSIRLFRSPPANMPSDLLFPLRLVPAGSPEFQKKMKLRGKSIVGEFSIIVHETRSKAWDNWAQESGIRFPEDTRVTRLDSMIAVARAAERGLGAALVPVPISNRWFASGGLVRLFDHELVTDVSYYLVCKEDRADDESVKLLRQWIVENFAEQDGAAAPGVTKR